MLQTASGLPGVTGSAESRDVLDELIEVIGMPAAILLSEAFPGVRVFVPVTIAADHPIATAIGVDVAAKLSKRYGSDILIVPKRAMRQKRNARLVEEYLGGASARELALRYRLHEFTVYAIVAAAGARRQQMDLFG